MSSVKFPPGPLLDAPKDSLSASIWNLRNLSHFWLQEPARLQALSVFHKETAVQVSVVSH